MRYVIKTIAPLACLAGLLIAPTASAESCQAKAAQVAASRGGKVLSVSASGSSCVIKLLVATSGGAPKRIVVTVPK